MAALFDLDFEEFPGKRPDRPASCDTDEKYWMFLMVEREKWRVKMRNAQVDDTVDLRGAFLPCTDLNRYDPCDMDFTGANLARSSLCTIVERSNFEGADLSGSNFTGASLEGCKFSGCKMEESAFIKTTMVDCDFTGSKLWGAMLHFTTAKECKFIKADFEQCELVKCNFDECDMDNVSMVSCDIRSVTFESSSTLCGSNFSMARFDTCRLKGVVMTGTTMRNAIAEHVSLADADLSGSTLTGTKFIASSFCSTKLIFCELIDVTYTYCNLDLVDISGARLSLTDEERDTVYPSDAINIHIGG